MITVIYQNFYIDKRKKNLENLLFLKLIMKNILKEKQNSR